MASHILQWLPETRPLLLSLMVFEAAAILGAVSYIVGTSITALEHRASVLKQRSKR